MGGGRVGVPIVYTWPAGSGEAIDYAYDRESGEFTIVHLKQLLYALATCPEIEKVHHLAQPRHGRRLHHPSRDQRRGSAGSPASLSSRPLAPERGVHARRRLPSRQMPWELLKLETWILAAAATSTCRSSTSGFFGENLVRAANRIVIYFSAEDKAFDWARWLFNSRRRLGELHIEDIPPDALKARPGRADPGDQQSLRLLFAQLHHAAPTYAMSNLLLLLRNGAAAGSPERPLGVACEGVWLLDNDYMNPEEEESLEGRGPRGTAFGDASFMD